MRYKQKNNYIYRCGGILIENIKFNDLPPLSSDRFALKRLKFIPRFDSSLDVSNKNIIKCR